MRIVDPLKRTKDILARPLAGKSMKYRMVVYFSALTIALLLLSIFRISTASLPFSSNGTDDAPVIFNNVRMTRSDDFLRGIPRWISYQQGGIPDSILDYSQSRMFTKTQTGITSKVLNQLLLPDDVVQRITNEIAPIEVKFAMREWLVYFRVLTVFPLFFILIGSRGRLGVLCGMTVCLTPLSLWFGGSAAAMTSAVLLPLVLIGYFVRVYHSQILFRIPLLAILGIYAGTYVFGSVEYPPWKWPILLVMGTMFLFTLLKQFEFRKVMTALLILSIPILLLQLFRLLAFHEQYTVTLDTVYPGKRRAAGGGGYGNPMSGAISWFMQTDESRSKGMVNPEFAFTLNALIWPAIISAPLMLLHKKREAIVYGYLASLIPLGVVILWVTSPWPTELRTFNPLTLVTTDRAGQILGVVALLLVFLLVQFRPPMSLRFRLVWGMTSAFLVFALSLPDSNYWNGYFFGTRSLVLVWMSVLGVALLAFMLFAIKQPVIAVLPILLFNLMSSYKIQPITVGLGPLLHSPVAQAIREIRQVNPKAVWGSDPFWSDALTMAQGVTMLSGQQPLGPNKELWRILDPTNQYVDSWNRGQSYIHFTWKVDEPGIRIFNANPDIISVVTSPCNPVLKKFGLRYIVTGSIPGTCMRKLSDHTWMAQPVAIYEVAL